MVIPNKTWHRNFLLLDEFEAGVVLTGAEAKSIHQGRVKLEAAYVRFSENNAFLVNTEVYKYKFDGSLEYDSTRRRQLLLHKKEIVAWKTKMQSTKGLTMIPISLFTKGRMIKVKIALVKGRNDTEKRRLEKDKKIKRSQQQELKEYIKK